MPRTDYDLVVVGGGSAGLVSAAVAAGLGARTLLVEKSRLGGECLWTGCVPSKALLHRARLAHLARTAGLSGVETLAAGALEYARGATLRVRDADGVEPLLRGLGVEFLYGTPRFTGPRELRVDGATLRARRFILATGSRPRVPDLPGLDQAGCLTNVSVWELERPPESLVVLGGGPVGVELAQAFARLGTQVTLLQRAARLLPREDPELTALVAARLREEGVDVRLSAEALAVTRRETGAVVRFRTEGRELAVEGAALLAATGRVPNVEDLGLEQAGIALTANGVRVDDRLRTTAAGIYACGDVTGREQYSHAAEYAAKVAVRNALLPLPQRARWDRMPRATFTDPELAHVGLHEGEARERGLRVEVFRHPFGQDDRALVDDEPSGMVKLVVAAGSGRLLGASILGPRAGELIQEAVLAIEQRLAVRHLADTVHVYPTLSVAVQRAAQYWWKARGDAPAARRGLEAYFRLWRRIA